MYDQSIQTAKIGTCNIYYVDHGSDSCVQVGIVYCPIANNQDCENFSWSFKIW